MKAKADAASYKGKAAEETERASYHFEQSSAAEKKLLRVLEQLKKRFGFVYKV